MAKIRFKRGAQAQVAAAAAAGQLVEGEPIYITDTQAVCVGTSPGGYKRLADHSDPRFGTATAAQVTVADITGGEHSLPVDLQGTLNALYQLKQSGLTGSGVVAVHPGGSDAAGARNAAGKPFASVSAAVAALQKGDTLLVARGPYNLGSGTVTLPAGVRVFAEPGARWTFDGSQALSAGKVCVGPGAADANYGPCEIHNLDIVAGLSGTTLCSPVGYASAGAKQDIHLHQCLVYGPTDALYCNVGSGAIRAWNCRLEGTWDLVYAAAAGQVIELYHCSLKWTPNKASTGLNSTSWGQTQNSAILRIWGGSITYSTGTGNEAIGAAQWTGLNAFVNSDGRIQLDGGFRRINAAGSDAKVPFWMCGIGMGSPSSVPIDVGSVAVDLSNYAGLQPALNAPPRLHWSDGSSRWVGRVISFGSSAPYNPPYFKGTATATAQTWNLLTLPPNALVEAVAVFREEGCAGAPTAVSVDVGTASSSRLFLSSANAKGSEGLAAQMSGPAVALTGGNPRTGTGTVITATVRTAGGNVSAVTAGVIHVMVRIGMAGQ